MLLLSAQVSTAQTVNLAALELCASLETPELKLACFEAIIAGARASDEPVPEAAATVTRENQPVVPEAEVAVVGVPANAPVPTRSEIGVGKAQSAGSEAAAVVAGSQAVPDATVVTSTMPSTEDLAREQLPAPDAPGSQAVPDTTPVASTTSSTEDFGREQLAVPDEEEKQEIFRATVIDVSQGYNKNLYFHLANGQIWRQIEARRFQYPKKGEFDVNISRGMMGEYRLRIGDNGRMVRIRRVQ